MSDHEQIPQVTEDKWVTVRKWANEQFAQQIWLNKSKILLLVCLYTIFKFFIEIPLFWWAMWANHSGHSPKMSDVSEFLRSLTKKEQPWAIRSGRSPKMSDHEQIAQVAHQKWANCSFFWANHSFAHFFAKKEPFTQKTDERISSPDS